jgi:hypothetical protein
MAPVMSKLDLIITISNLSDSAGSCMFVDSSENDYRACSTTFFQGKERATIGIVYTAEKWGTARVFNGQMKVVAEVVERLTVDEYNGIRNMMLKIQKDLGTPGGLDADDLQDFLDGKDPE